MEIQRKYYKLNELSNRWEKYGITELDILNIAIEGKLLFSVWFCGDTLSLRDGVTEEEIIAARNETLVSGFKKEMVYLPSSEVMAFLSKDKVFVSSFIDNKFKKFKSKICYSSIPRLVWQDAHEYRREELCLEYKQVINLDAWFENEFAKLKTDQLPTTKQQLATKTSIPPVSKKSGAPKSAITEVVEYMYDLLLKEGRIEILESGNIGKFIIKLQEFKKSAPTESASFIFDNIKDVKKISGKWTIRTEDRTLKDSAKRETIAKAKTYGQNDISKILNRLRKEKPLTP